MHHKFTNGNKIALSLMEMDQIELFIVSYYEKYCYCIPFVTVATYV